MSLIISFTPYTFADTSTHITFQIGHTMPGETLDYSAPAKFPDIPTTNSTMENILPILNRIIIHKEAKDFLRPVDPILDKAENYKIIISNPIDLSTILQKANSNDYKKFADFTSDLKLLVTNAMKYNSESHPVHRSAVALSNYINNLLNQLKDSSNMSIIQPNESQYSKEAEKQIGDALNDYNARKKRLMERRQIEQEKPIKMQPQFKKASEKDISILENGIRRLRGTALMSVIEIIENKQFQKSFLPYEVNFEKCDSIKIKKLKKLINHDENSSNKISYVWVPAIPDDLQDIKDKYETEFMNWLKPPPPTSTQ
ncbi:hypothetical protein M9Y10_008748 [Tritrichomonas musculus]|uniref:Bromo domain-containing protein n=1 Tax=Tritrichomonas musculus TaxID=1915356 RepID=A0ABR2J1I9_9EUKA